MTNHNVKIEGFTGSNETRVKALRFELDGLVIDHDDLFSVLACIEAMCAYEVLEIEVSFDTSNV